MIKKLSLVNGLMMLISLNSLYAEKISLLTNDMLFNYGYTGFSGLCDLFTIEDENGFCAIFSINDSFVSTNTVITYTAVFSNAKYLKKFRKYTDEPMNVKEGFLIAIEMPSDYLCRVFMDDRQISKFIFKSFFDYSPNIFDNELVFKDGFKHSYKLKLSDEYRYAIYKKIELYFKEKQVYLKKYEFWK